MFINLHPDPKLNEARVTEYSQAFIIHFHSASLFYSYINIYMFSISIHITLNLLLSFLISLYAIASGKETTLET